MSKNVIKVLFWVNAFFFVTNVVLVSIGAILFGDVEWINLFSAMFCLAGLWASQQMQES
jgi:hypothetical protein